MNVFSALDDLQMLVALKFSQYAARRGPGLIEAGGGSPSSSTKSTEPSACPYIAMFTSLSYILSASSQERWPCSTTSLIDRSRWLRCSAAAWKREIARVCARVGWFVLVLVLPSGGPLALLAAVGKEAPNPLVAVVGVLFRAVDVVLDFWQEK